MKEIIKKKYFNHTVDFQIKIIKSKPGRAEWASRVGSRSAETGCQSK